MGVRVRGPRFCGMGFRWVLWGFSRPPTLAALFAARACHLSGAYNIVDHIPIPACCQVKSGTSLIHAEHHRKLRRWLALLLVDDQI